MEDKIVGQIEETMHHIETVVGYIDLSDNKSISGELVRDWLADIYHEIKRVRDISSTTKHD